MKRQARLKQGLILAVGFIVTTVCGSVSADSHHVVASSPGQAISANAALDFQINIGKFIYFRVGTGVFPATSNTVDTLTFTTSPSLPVGATDGNSVATSWDGSMPVFTSIADAVLPVEVRSNAGQISIRATVASPLSDGSRTLPFSDIHIVSDDSNFPAPPIPGSGTGDAVQVVGTSFANLITERTANWTFSYVGSGASSAGTYSGTVTFTASSP